MCMWEKILWHSYIIIICIFGCKRKGWRMSLYFIRIKPKWTIGQPFTLYIHMIKIVIHLFKICKFVYNWLFGCKRKGWRMGFYFIRIKPRWTIEQPFTLSIYDDEFIFTHMIFWNLCIIDYLVVKKKVDVWAFIL